MPAFEFQQDLFPGPITLIDAGIDKVTINILKKRGISTLDEVWRLPDRKLMEMSQIGLHRLNGLRHACKICFFTEYAHERRIYDYSELLTLALAVYESGRYPAFHNINVTIRDEKDPRRTVTIFDKEKSVASIAVTMQRGIEAGLSPLIALHNIVYFNNYPCVWGDVGIAMVQSHPSYAGMTVERFEEGNNWGYRCTIARRFDDKIRNHTEEFSLEEAIQARLMRLQHYQDYPQRMFEWRAKTNAYRFMFADALRGLSIAEEQRDIELIRALDAQTLPTATLPTDRFTAAASKQWEEIEFDVDKQFTDLLTPGNKMKEEKS